MPAEVRIAQGCFVFSQRNTLQTDSFALVGRQPCIIARGRKSCLLVSATVGGVDSAGLFAYKEWLKMIRRIQGFEEFILYYDCESKKCIITIRDAANANQEQLGNIADACDAHRREVDIIGRYVDAGKRWDNISDDDLRLIIDFWGLNDQIKQTAKEELESRLQKRMGYVYLLQADNGLYKIGQSKVIDNRIKQLGLKLPYELNLVSTVLCLQYKELEAHLHERFADKHVRGEWFELDDADVEYIKGLGVEI